MILIYGASLVLAFTSVIFFLRTSYTPPAYQNGLHSIQTINAIRLLLALTTAIPLACVLWLSSCELIHREKTFTYIQAINLPVRGSSKHTGIVLLPLFGLFGLYTTVELEFARVETSQGETIVKLLIAPDEVEKGPDIYGKRTERLHSLFFEKDK